MGVQGLLEGLILVPRDEDAVGWHRNTTGTGSASQGCSVGTSSYRLEECGDQGGNQCQGLGWRGGWWVWRTGLEN